jgi:hypothetical protein
VDCLPGTSSVGRDDSGVSQQRSMATVAPVPFEDGLGSSISPTVNRGVAQLASTAVSHSYEQLGEDEFRSTPFVPPSLRRAADAADEEVMGERSTAICTTGLQAITTAGVGIGIWFRFLWISALLFFALSVLSIPTFSAGILGGRISKTSSLSSQDPFGFATMSIGNTGPPAGSVFGASCKGNCSAASVTVTFLPGIIELPTLDATLVFSLADLAVSLCLLGFLFVFWRSIRYVEMLIGENNLDTAAYSVLVWGLPKDVTEAEVREHFDRLYNLRAPDWLFEGFCCGCMSKTEEDARPIYSKPTKAKRGGVRAAHDSGGVVVAPVLNATNTGDASYLRSWVAEVTLARPNGALVQRYKTMRNRLRMIKRKRAIVKMFSAPSPYADERKKAQAMKDLQAAEVAMRQVDSRLSKQYREEVVAAFVVFNTEESRRRAVFDYAWSVNPCLRVCQPTPLRFHRDGHHPIAIRVEPAPDPGDVLWENLELSGCDRCGRQSLSTLTMLLLTLVSLVFLILAQQASKIVSQDTPEFSVCNGDALLLPAGSTKQQAAQYGASANLEIYRDASLDSTCPGASVGLYVANTLTSPPTPAPLLSGYSPSNCTSFCVDPDSASSPFCAAPGSATRFRKSDLVPCYCVNLISSTSKRSSIFSALAQVANDNLCVTFVGQYAIRNGLVAVAAVMVVVINLVLKSVARGLTKFERHVSVGSRQSAQVVKILALTFLNTALITALVNYKFALDGIPSWMRPYIGEVNGLEPRWFAAAGSSIVLTMALNVVSINALTILQCPCLFLCPKPRIAPPTSEYDERLQAFALQPEGLAVEDPSVFSPERSQEPTVRAYLRDERRFADTVRIAQSALTGCDRCCAQSCACCGPGECCACLPTCCDGMCAPTAQCWGCCRGARARAAVTQAELDALVSVGAYNVEDRWPLALNTFFVCVTYGSGLPLLYPIAMVAFLLAFQTERCTLLRSVTKPPIMDASLARLSLRLLPLAVVLHLVVSILVFSDANLLQSRSILDSVGALDQSAVDWYRNQFGGGGSSANAGTSFLKSLEKEAVIPSLALLLLIVIVTVVMVLIGGGVRRFCRCFLVMACCGRQCCDFRKIEELKSNPPFTGVYAQPLPLGVKHFLAEDEKEEGWRIERDPNNLIDRKAQRKTKVWTQDGWTNGKPHSRGDRMLTWETIADVGIASYNPTANPEYAAAFVAMEEAVGRSKRNRELLLRMADERVRMLRAQAEDMAFAGGGRDSVQSDVEESSTVAAAVAAGAGAMVATEGEEGMDSMAWQIPDEAVEVEGEDVVSEVVAGEGEEPEPMSPQDTREATIPTPDAAVPTPDAAVPAPVAEP